MPAKIVIIAAVAANRVIGSRGGMPWKLSTDLKRFKALTIGKPVIMGRKTFETIGRPLAGRTNIVVTTDPSYDRQDVVRAASVEEAVEYANRIAAADGIDEICIIGGGQIYEAAYSLADRLYVTHVDAAPDGDTFFPLIDNDWSIVHSEDIAAGGRDSSATRFVIYEREPDKT